MTGSGLSEKRSSCNESVCSETEKGSYAKNTSSEKVIEKVSSATDREKSDATYTKHDPENSIQKASKKIPNEWLKNKKNISELQRPFSTLHSLRNNGILEPSFLTSKRAQWLVWNDPVFSRRQSVQEQRLRRRHDSNLIQEQKSTVASFKRSLQLLGLKDQDLGLNYTSKNKSNNNHNNTNSRGRATPTFSTQLKQRSVSLTNLRNAVQESGLPTAEAIEKMHRDILSRAVYEEWYFRKQIENKIKKELEEQIKKKQNQELEWIKLERKKRAEENFEKWKREKKALKGNQEKHAEDTTKGEKPSTYAKVKPGAEKAFEAWKAKKDEEMKAKSEMRKRLEKEKKRKTEEEEKKAAADAAFRAWKKQVDAELRNKLMEREKEKKIAEEKKEKELKEKREISKLCFMKWKTYKDTEIKQNLELKRLKSKQKAEEKTIGKKEREYEAAQAFEEWLDQVEEREKQKCKSRKNSKTSLNTEIPPWYPVC